MTNVSLGATATPSQPPTSTNPPDVVGHRQTFTQTSGRILSLALKGDNTIRVLATDAGSATATQVGSVTIPSGSGVSILTGALQANNDLWIAVLRYDRSGFSVCRFNNAANTFSAWETRTVNVSGTSVYSMDMDVTDNNAVVVAVNYVQPGGPTTAVADIHTRTTGATWVTSNVDTLSALPGSGVAVRRGGFAISVVALNASGAVRNMVIGTGRSFSSGDLGVQFIAFKVNEGTGAVTAVNWGSDQFVDDFDKGDTATTPRRLIKMFRVGTDRFVAGVAHSTVNRKVSRLVLEYNGTGGVTTLSGLGAVTFTGVGGGYGAFSVGMGYLNYITSSSIISSLVTYRTMFFSYETATSGQNGGDDSLKYGVGWGPLPLYMGSGGGKTPALSKLPVVGTAWRNVDPAFPFQSTLMYASVPLPSGGQPIVTLSPSNGAVLGSSNPSLSAGVDLDLNYGQSPYRLQFQFASNATFTTGLVDYLQEYGKSKFVTGTDTAGIYTLFTDTLPGSFALTGSGAIYFRARVRDVWGNVGPWTATRTVTIGHPPVPVLLAPSSGSYIPWNDGNIDFSWAFTDPSPTDTQSAYQLDLYSVETNEMLLNTGKVISSVKNLSFQILDDNYKDLILEWMLTLWDSENTISATSPSVTFIATDPPSATITSPANGATVATGVPTITFSLTNGGGRGIKEYTVVISQNGVDVWSKRVTGLFSPGSFSEKVPTGILNNYQDYTVRVTAVDPVGLTAASALVPFHVAWVPPDPPSGVAVDIAPYNQIDEGYVSVTWDDLARDPDYIAYLVYRKSDLIDPGTLAVISEGDLELIYTEYEIGTGYEFKDYFAPSNYKVSYLVRQMITRDGQDMVSDDDSLIASYPQSDGYWLIEPDSDNADADAFKLSIVTGDTFVDEQEESETVVIGRGRRVERGDYLGVKGTLEAQIRSTGGTSARQKRLQLLQIQQADSPLWLRNPFGDCFRVSVSNMSVTRVAGTGASEFCDISIPYSEVAR